jgi:iron(III) transport system permease protein
MTDHAPASALLHEPGAPLDPGASRDSGALRRLRIDLFGLIGWPIVVALVALIVYPLVTAVVRSFVGPTGLDLEPLQAVLGDPAFGRAFGNTLIVIALAGTAAVVVGSIFAWLNERTDASLGAVSGIAPLIPLLMPPVTLAVGWVFLAQPTVGFLNGYLRGALGLVGIQLRTGPLDIGTWPGLLFVYTIALVPFAYVVVSPAFRNMDTALEEASRMSGAGPLRTAFSVSLPVIGPSILLAALLVVVVAAAMFSIPAIIGTSARVQTLSVYIVQLTQVSAAGLDRAVAAASVLVVFIASVWATQRAVSHRQKAMTISGKSGSGTRVRLGPWRWVARIVILAYFLTVAVLPFLALTIVAVQPFWTATIDPAVFTTDAIVSFFQTTTATMPRDALFLSLQLGLVGGTLVMLAATILVTYAQHAGRRTANLIRGVTKVPAAISGLVIAVAILFTFAGPPFSLKGSFLILLLAYLVMFMPQASIAAESARGQVGDELLEASAMAGGSRLRTSLRILWPLMRPGLAYGWAMIFVLIFGDLIAAAILSGPGNMVVGAAIVEIYSGGIFRDLAVLGMIVTATALVIVGVVVTFAGRRSDQRRSGGSSTPPAAPLAG